MGLPHLSRYAGPSPVPRKPANRLGGVASQRFLFQERSAMATIPLAPGKVAARKRAKRRNGDPDIGFAPLRLFIVLVLFSAMAWWFVDVNASLALPL